MHLNSFKALQFCKFWMHLFLNIYFKSVVFLLEIWQWMMESISPKSDVRLSVLPPAFILQVAATQENIEVIKQTVWVYFVICVKIGK